MKHWKTYAAFIAITFAVGFLSAAVSAPDAWYEGLKKPWFNPPNWVFPIAWTILYVFIGVAGGRIWVAGLLGLPFLFWLAQMGFNGLWSFLFFNQHAPALALIDAVLMLAAIIGFILTTWRPVPLAARLFLPYAAWVAFATFLNGVIVFLNR
ncbi:MAG: tryptophan-rich sensory protein [Rhizobiales bacterium]|nr:tryptophan-rich sensory protein [Hyphomicrobiales bacterium]